MTSENMTEKNFLPAVARGVRKTLKRFVASTANEDAVGAITAEQILDSAAEGICLVDDRGRCVYANRALQQMLGCRNPEELLNRNLHELLRSEGQEASSDGKSGWSALHHLRQGRVYHGERANLVRCDGAEQVVEYWAHPFEEERDGFQGAVVTFLDMNERVAIAESLRSHDDHLRYVIEHTPNALAVLDRDLRYLFVSRRFLDDYRLKSSDIIGKGHYEVFPEVPDRWKAIHQRCLAGNVEKSEFDYFYRQDGSVDYNRWEVRPWYDGEGRIGGIIMYTEVITERVMAEEKIREQAQYLDKAAEAIRVVDLEGRIRYWNPSSERQYGWAGDEVLGRRYQELLQPDGELSTLDLVDALLEQGEWRGEQRQIRRNGSELIVESHCTLIRDAKGQPKSILMIDHDITERKQMEERLLRTQRLESLGTLAGGIAHDLNNVFAPIMMAADMLAKKTDDPAAQRLVDLVTNSAQRGADMVRQVLLFARGAEGKRIAMGARAMVNEVVTIIRETFPKSITLRMDLAPTVGKVQVDPTQIHQVLLNLCVNARDAMPEGGTLSIASAVRNFDRTTARQVGELRPGRYMELRVEDTGTGIPQEVLNRIFEPFFTTKETGKGTGLGLSTVLSIVQAHDGSVDVYSEPGRGTRFTVLLPLVEDEQPQDAEELVEPGIGSGQRILLVDDEVSVREVGKLVLESSGYEVMEAADGIDALEKLEEMRVPVDLVIVDMMMPRMNGPEFIVQMKQAHPEIPVIGSSGIAMRAEEARRDELPMDAFLHKPYEAKTLLATVSEALMPRGETLAGE